MDLGPVIEAFDAVAAQRPLAVTLLRGEEVVLRRAAGARFDGRAFGVDTPVLLYSVAKAAVGMTASLLAATGRLDLDAPVATYWPAFAAHGKDDVTVAQALAHGAGVPAWPVARDLADLVHIEEACAALADQPAWWPAGDPGEHIYTYGHLVSGITKGATGRHVHELWADELAGPHGIGLVFTPPPDREPMRDPGGAFAARMAERRDSVDPRLWEPAALTDPVAVNGLGAGPAPVVPAVLGWAGADAVARLFALWARGAEVLPGDAAAWRRGTTTHSRGTDRVMGFDVAWGFGVGIEGPTWGMGGIGGCVGWHNAANGLSVGITTPVLAATADVTDDLEVAIDASR